MSKKKLCIIYSLVFVLLVLVGFAYAYFSVDFYGVESESSVIIGGAEMSISYSDNSPNIIVNGMYPQDEAWATKTFTITGVNTSTSDMAYQLLLIIENNTFLDDALSFSLTGTNSSETGLLVSDIEEEPIKTGAHSVEFGEGKFSGKSEEIVHTYVFNLYFKETETNQSANMNKSFAAYIKVNPYNAVVNGVKLAMQRVTKDGNVVALSSVPDDGDFVVNNDCNDANVEWDEENKQLISSTTNVLGFCKVEFKDAYNVQVVDAENATISQSKEGYVLLSAFSNAIEKIGHFFLNHYNKVGYKDTFTVDYTPDPYYYYDKMECTGTHGAITNYNNTISVADVQSDMECQLSLKVDKHNVTFTNNNNHYSLGNYGQVNKGDTVIIPYTLEDKYTLEGVTCNGTHGEIRVENNSIIIPEVTSDLSCNLNAIYVRSLNLAILGEGNANVSKTKTVPGQQNTTSLEAVLASTPDDYGTSYYYRGAVQNNYIVFANMCWRIMRVTGNGAIKLVLYNYNPNNVANPCGSAADGTSNAFARYNGSSYTSNFNSSINNNAYAGFMYGDTGASSYAGAHANTNKSTILNNLESWYNNVLSKSSGFDESKLADVIYCNDKSIDTFLVYYSSPGYGSSRSSATGYSARGRILGSEDDRLRANPSLICPNDSNGGKLSKFTADETEYGNGALTYKIGLLSADEVSFAGYLFESSNTSCFLYKNATASDWWTMSPSVFNYILKIMMMQFAKSDGELYDVYYLNTTKAIRPSIALKKDILIVGDGTQSSPYIVR